LIDNERVFAQLQADVADTQFAAAISRVMRDYGTTGHGAKWPLIVRCEEEEGVSGDDSAALAMGSFEEAQPRCVIINVRAR
jgi:hypothetical protein